MSYSIHWLPYLKIIINFSIKVDFPGYAINVANPILIVICFEVFNAFSTIVYSFCNSIIINLGTFNLDIYCE